MVQEFHVLRCFSCQTFQVQQVKKSKKWGCKMCGEKQSLKKEYGRGTGADCRRHVQKLNSLRGELLEVENERACAQWEEAEEEEEEECEIEVKVEPGDKNESWVQMGREQDVSRWSKYVEEKDDGPGCEEDEQEEEERVYTDEDPHRQHNNISRKRKKSFASGADCGRYIVGVDVDDVEAARRGGTEPSQGRRHDAALKPQAPHTLVAFPCTSTRAPAASLGSKHVSVSNRLYSEAKDSKWAQFLSPVCVEEDTDEQDGGSGEDSRYNVDRSVMPVPTGPGKNTACTSGGGFSAEGKGSVVEKPSRRVNGNVCERPNSPTITPIPLGNQKPECVQPLTVKRPCPAGSFSALFHTDEDFDDAY